MAQYKGTAADAARSSFLAKQRDAEARTFAEKQEAIRRDNAVQLRAMEEAFSVRSAVTEEAFKAATVGLVSAAEFREKRQQVEEAGLTEERQRQQEAHKERIRREQQRKSKLAALSFHTADDEETDDSAEADSRRKTKDVAAASSEEKKESAPAASSAAFTAASSASPAVPSSTSPAASSSSIVSVVDGSAVAASAEKRRKLTKNPDVDTHFLPDVERQREEAALRQQLSVQWQQQQQLIKAQLMSVTYSYWDGSGHRRRLSLAKGSTVQQFLELARRQCMDEFSELRALSASQLLYVKEDLMLPAALSFYELIVTKARGKSGPLFHFDVHDDVRLEADARVEKDESHAGKVCTRAWYERNQHIFPASRWEPYDPAVSRDRYTVKGGEVK